MKKIKLAVVVLAALLLAVLPASFAKAATKGTNSFIGAPEIKTGKEYTVSMEDEHDTDLVAGFNEYGDQGKCFYKVNVPSDGKYVVTFKSGGSKELFYEFYDPNYTQLTYKFYMTWDTPAFKAELDLKAGDHYVAVYSYERNVKDKVIGSFNISPKKKEADDVTYNTSEKAYTSDDFDIPTSDSYTEAKRLTIGEEYTIGLGSDNGTNIVMPEKIEPVMFKFLVTKKSTYEIRFKTAIGEGHFVLLNKDYEKVYDSSYLRQGTNFKLVELTPGTYYVRVISYQDDFTGAFSLKNTQVKVKSLKAGSKKLTAKWSSFDNAAGYEIRYSTKKNMADAQVVTTTGSKTSYTLKKLKNGKAYFVQVRAYEKNNYNETVYGSWSEKMSKKVK